MDAQISFTGTNSNCFGVFALLICAFGAFDAGGNNNGGRCDIFHDGKIDRFIGLILYFKIIICLKKSDNFKEEKSKFIRPFLFWK